MRAWLRRRRPWVRRAAVGLLVAHIALVTAADLWIVLSSGTTDVGLDDALAHYRAGNPPTAPATGGDGDAAAASSTTEATTVDAVGAATSTTATPTTDAATPTTSTTVPTGPTFAAPEPGVYAYGTTGSARLNAAGASHEYPDTTYAILTYGDGCRWSVEHDMVKEVTDQLDFCWQGDQLDLLRWKLDRTFLNVTYTLDFACQGARLLPAAVEAAQFNCSSSEGDTASGAIQYAGAEVVDVGGSQVTAQRIVITGELSGSMRGTFELSMWLDPATGLRLKEQRQMDARAGFSQYSEEGQFVLLSLQPSR